jgi:hypothetical protein
MNQLPPNTRALLAAARTAKPPPRAKARVDARLAATVGAAAIVVAAPAAVASGAAMSTAAAAPVAAAPVAAAVTGSALGVKSIVLIGTLIVGSGLWIGSRLGSAPPPPPRSADANAIVAMETAATPVAAPPRPGVAVAAGSVSASAEPPPSETSPAPKDPSPRPSHGLGKDSAAMSQALRALHDGDSEGALRALDAVGSAGTGPLAEERAATRVLALCAAGRVDDARAAAADFLSRYPSSAHAGQVRGSCAKAP